MNYFIALQSSTVTTDSNPKGEIYFEYIKKKLRLCSCSAWWPVACTFCSWATRKSCFVFVFCFFFSYKSCAGHPGFHKFRSLPSSLQFLLEHSLGNNQSLRCISNRHEKESVLFDIQIGRSWLFKRIVCTSFLV